MYVRMYVCMYVCMYTSKYVRRMYVCALHCAFHTNNPLSPRMLHRKVPQAAHVLTSLLPRLASQQFPISKTRDVIRFQSCYFEHVRTCSFSTAVCHSAHTDGVRCWVTECATGVFWRTIGRVAACEGITSFWKRSVAGGGGRRMDSCVSDWGAFGSKAKNFQFHKTRRNYLQVEQLLAS
jgi:hypothetical protein